MRVLDEGNGGKASLWYELEPNRFWCGNDLADAEDTRRMLPRLGQTGERVRQMFPNVTERKA